MNNRRMFLGGFVSLAGMALVGCDKLQQTSEAAGVLLNPGKGSKRWPDYRYRLIVEVDTPEGVKSGSSVIEVSTAVSGSNDIASPGSLYTEARGEAVTIDLGERGLLFALLRSEQDEEWAAWALQSVFPRLTGEELSKLRDDEDELVPMMERLFKLPLDTAIPLPRQIETGFVKNYKPEMMDNYPMLVRFDDLAKPETVKQVDPDNLAASFGAGVRLKSISIARTEAGITKGIEKKLMWLEPVGRKRGTLIPNPPRFRKDAKDPLMQYLNLASFSTELFK